MSEWTFAQSNPSEELAQLHYFSMKKRQSDAEVEFLITVREFATRNQQAMRFFAQADKQVNQKTAPFTPCGWGETLLEALRECIRGIHRFPYEGPGES
jgi:hypothetical protein